MPAFSLFPSVVVMSTSPLFCRLAFLMSGLRMIVSEIDSPGLFALVSILYALSLSSTFCGMAAPSWAGSLFILAKRDTSRS